MNKTELIDHIAKHDISEALFYAMIEFIRARVLST